MTENEWLIAISAMLDKELKLVKDTLKQIEFSLENDMLSRLQNIEKLQKIS